MKDTEKTIEIAALLHHYYHQSLNGADEQKLLEWLESRPENREHFEKIRQKLKENGQQTNTKYDLKVETALQNVKRMMHEAAHTPTPLYKRFLPYAAAVILFIIAGFIFQSRYGQVDVLTTHAETKEIYLPDGTYVKLEPCSKLTYSKKIGRGDRAVGLEGAAYFKVAKNEQHPFSVQSNQVKVEVLGTSFRLKAYTADEEASVLVTSGKVRVSGAQASSSTATLDYGKKAIFTKNKDLKTQSLNQQDIAKIATGIIVYSGEPIQSVIADLARSYNVRINCQEDLKSRLFFGELDPKEELPIFLKKLTMTVHATWKQTGSNQYIIQLNK